ncbi:nuclear transport factor 2 family protein [Nocardia sp. CDC159]|uniref:Nuclear transport factor 2 family protein n=1 Tax=Nocardia pulmonis TaxID=2951408 RepID=A0A9X2J279_9NOCA|nr:MULTISPECIES: nuclear transport factor 2 family protein [Nocardia]MCM6778885.1 nuclear transport factor 2 family protein [Nocardia pulmonis]MCM6791774.1 nuclear transport factor 2 family protein [Nocardia sp. CDC159]
MSDSDSRAPIVEPEDIIDVFVARIRAADADGLAALYEPDAVLAVPGGPVVRGLSAIREAYAQFLATEPVYEIGERQPPLLMGELALTAHRWPGGDITVDVLRRQPDGTWLCVISQPRIN